MSAKLSPEAEREFLHDVAGALGTAILLADALSNEFNERSTTNPDDLLRVAEIMQVLEKLKALLVARRRLVT